MTIVVAGGTKGMGLEIAKAFAVPKAKLVLNFHADEVSAVAAERAIRDAGADCTLVRADVGTVEGCAAIADAARTMGGPVDQFIHSAVDPLSCVLSEVEPKRFGRAVAVGGLSLLYLVQALLPLMKKGSSIFFLTGRGAREVIPKYAALGVSKALAEALVRYLAPELAPKGIRINCIAPSAVLTDAFAKVIGEGAEELIAEHVRTNPSGRAIEPRDYTSLIKFLASPDAEYVTGQVFRVNGGSSIIA